MVKSIIITLLASCASMAVQADNWGAAPLIVPGVLIGATLLNAANQNNAEEQQRLEQQRIQEYERARNLENQRRADLVPNIVATVKGEANFEQETLTQVIEARAKATSFQITPEVLTNPQALQQFQAMQGQLSSALSRLMVVSEQYPNLKANQGFADLRVQLEGTENRITVARNRYIAAVKDYNILARSFPSNLTAMVFGYAPKANFTVANEAAISAPPKVDFGK
jgi:LemA protein